MTETRFEVSKAKTELPGQLEMFETGVPVVVAAPTPAPKGKPKYVKYRPVNPERCDDCFESLVALEGRGNRCRQAKYKRTSSGGTLLLCYAHTQERRTADGLTPLRREL